MGAVRASFDLVVRTVSTAGDRAAGAFAALMTGGTATADQVSSLTDDVVRSGRANRDAVGALVRVEVERALGRLGLATHEEVRALSARLAAVEGASRHARRTVAPKTDEHRTAEGDHA